MLSLAPTTLLLPLLFTLLTTAPRPTAAYTGDLTHFDPSIGLTSCGYHSLATDDVVALSFEMMANPANPNANPKCGTKIGIWNPHAKTHHWATVVDSCGACKKYDIDVSDGLFGKIAPEGDGRVKGVNWGGVAVGG